MTEIDELTSIEQYRQLLNSLLPPGPAWTDAEESNLQRLLKGLAVEYTRLDMRANQLRIEANPRLMNELLIARETEAGLPDPCSGLGTTIQARINAVVAKWAERGGQSIQYYADLLNALGFSVDIIEYIPFRAGRGRSGQPVCSTAWIHYWQVTAAEFTIIYFRSGLSTAGEPLRSWGNFAFECIAQRLKPAHTKLLLFFTEGEEVGSSGFQVNF